MFFIYVFGECGIMKNRKNKYFMPVISIVLMLSIALVGATLYSSLIAQHDEITADGLESYVLYDDTPIGDLTVSDSFNIAPNETVTRLHMLNYTGDVGVLSFNLTTDIDPGSDGIEFKTFVNSVETTQFDIDPGSSTYINMTYHADFMICPGIYCFNTTFVLI